MKRQEDLDKYNDDLQWDKFIDRIMWVPCMLIMFLIGAYIYRHFQDHELIRVLFRM